MPPKTTSDPSVSSFAAKCFINLWNLLPRHANVLPVRDVSYYDIRTQYQSDCARRNHNTHTHTAEENVICHSGNGKTTLSSTIRHPIQYRKCVRLYVVCALCIKWNLKLCVKWTRAPGTATNCDVADNNAIVFNVFFFFFFNFRRTPYQEGDPHNRIGAKVRLRQCTHSTHAPSSTSSLRSHSFF